MDNDYQFLHQTTTVDLNEKKTGDKIHNQTKERFFLKKKTF